MRKPINKPNKNVKKITKKVNSTSTKRLNKSTKNNDRYIKDIIDKRYIFVIFVIIILFIIIVYRLFDLQVLKTDEYQEKLVLATEKSVTSTSTPRGRIYDRNHNLLVDNEAIKTIYYKKPEGIKTKDEISLAYKVAELIEVDYSKLSDNALKNFWYLNNLEKARKKVKDEEWEQKKNRKLTDDDIKKIIFERIGEEELKDYNDLDKEAAYIYFLMNKGYSYAEKIIKNENVLEEEYAIISENIDNLEGVNTKLDWQRKYMYDDVFKSILGTVSSNSQGIPSELADYYLENGYSMDDRVGISYLEYQYEKYLKGTKAKYRVLNNNTYELIEEGKRGNDIVLTIDIDLQKYLEEMLAQEVMIAKGEPNTEYYNRTFVVVSDPATGEILAMAGKQYKDGKIVDYTPGVVTLPVTPGSIVKGASMLVGYKYGAIDIGSYQLDECIKIQATPEKCSWRTMGMIDDIYALEQSSNVYQYKIAIKVGKGTYRYDEPLAIDKEAFEKYRNMYASFGLGIKTEIDLPVESLGYMGKSTLPGHLLDFAIGQYDTYTPIQLSQYINTIANGGNRLKPYLLKEVYAPSVNKDDKFGSLIYKTEKEVLGTVDVEKKYFDRVRYGFSRVISNGLGNGYMGYQYDASGKTGTSQSFIDTTGDGKVDTETITSSFVGYAPSENPKMSVIVVSPDISHDNESYTYQSAVTKRVTTNIVNKFFEIYQ